MPTESELQPPRHLIGTISAAAVREAKAAGFFGTATGAVAITAILYGVLIGGRLAYHNWDPSFFVVAGDDFCQPPLVPKGLMVSPGDGYDGQFYYRLALDPFTRIEFGNGIALDDPPYRQQRILYPLLAHLAAFGTPAWVPWTMLLINYLAVCLLAYSAGRLAELFGISAFYVLALPFYPGILLALDRDLTDVLSASLVVTALFLLHSHRMLVAAVALALAVLTRETVVVLSTVLLLCSLWLVARGRSNWKEPALLAIPIAAYFGWQLWLFARWGRVAALQRVGSDANTNISWGLPFSGLLPTLNHGIQLAAAYQPLLLGELSLIVAIVLIAATRVFRSATEPGLNFTWLFYLILTAMLSQNEWVEDWAFMRGVTDVIVMSLIILLGARSSKLITMVTVPTFAIWAVLATHTVVTQ